MGQRLTASIKQSFTGANIGKGLVQGLGLAGALSAVNLASNAISGLGNVVGDSISAFREDQVSVQKLGTALRDNVAAWDGNTDAIERTIKARTALGFSDDDQRAGLATLVASTKDATTALQLEAGAMDIARARNTDLATAADAVAKAYAGNTKQLKSLIPGLNLGKSSAEALANAFATVGGAASDFAKTDLGKTEVEAAKVNEAMEKLGSVLSGPVADGATAAADALTGVLDALDTLQGQSAQAKGVNDSISELISTNNLDGLRKAQAALADATDKFKHPELIFAPATFNILMGQLADVNFALTHFRNVADGAATSAFGFGTAIDQTANTMEANRGTIGDSLAAIESGSYLARGQIVKIGSAAKGAMSATRTATRTMKQAWADYVAALIGDANDLLDKAFNVIDAKQQLLADNAEILSAKAVIASKKSTAAEIADAKASIVSATESTAQQLIILAKSGHSSSEAFKTGLANLKTFAATTKGDLHTALEGVVTDIEKIEKAAKDSKPVITFKVKIPKFSVDSTGHVVHVPTKGGYDEFASGGITTPGVPYWVGERGPELRVDSVPGRIIPAGQSAAIAGETNQVIVQGLLPVRTVADVRREMMMLSDVRKIRRPAFG